MFFSYSTQADAVPSYSTSGNKFVVIGITNTGTNRPRMPMRHQLVCIYDNGHLEFVLPPDINSINVVVENDSGIIWEGTIDRENLSADIPVLTSNTEICCITDGGQEFHGTIVIENGGN